MKINLTASQTTICFGFSDLETRDNAALNCTILNDCAFHKCKNRELANQVHCRDELRSLLVYEMLALLHRDIS